MCDLSFTNIIKIKLLCYLYLTWHHILIKRLSFAFLRCCITVCATLEPSKMTTAARPTFEPARGGRGKGEGDLSALSKQYSSRDLPGHTKIKYRSEDQTNWQFNILNVLHLLSILRVDLYWSPDTYVVFLQNSLCEQAAHPGCPWGGACPWLSQGAGGKGARCCTWEAQREGTKRLVFLRTLNLVLK